MSKNHKQNPYGTGYGKPPIDNQFKKGQSGNPNGRPAGAKNKTATEAAKLVELVRAEAAREITTGSEGEHIGIQQAVVRSILVNGVKGKAYAQRHSIDLIRYAEKEMYEKERKESTEPFELLCAGASLQAKLSELEMACKASGKPYPNIMPKSSDVILDFDRGDVTFRFPFGEAERKVWDGVWAQKHFLVQEQAVLGELMKRDTLSCSERDQIEVLLESHEQLLELICKGMWEKWHIEPDDMSGDVCDLDVFMERILTGDPVLEKFVTMSGYLITLRDLRRVIETQAGLVN